VATRVDTDRQQEDTLHAPHVGDGITTPAGSWTFGGEVPAAFDSHVARSVPAYTEGQELIADIADQLVPPGGRVYDLGCSTGALTAQLAERLAPRRVEVVGVDREPGMIERAALRCAALPQVRFETAPLQELTLQPADMVISYYTLQFIPLRARAEILARIHEALVPGGTFVLFEKVLASSARNQATAAGAYADWKGRQGFGDEEIAAKARSIRGVLQPLSPEENDAMLHAAGFSDLMRVFRWVLFEGLIARA
jgi:tRNA (cmo5U34)-methyltransferase